MPTRPSRFVAFVLTLIALGGLAACSSSSKSSSSSSSGDKAAFCKTSGDLDAAAKDVQTPDQLVKAFKDNDALLDTLLKQAPPEIKADTEKLVTAAKKAASTGDASQFTNGDQALQDAGQHLTAFCGPTSGSSPSGSSGSSESTSSST